MSRSLSAASSLPCDAVAPESPGVWSCQRVSLPSALMASNALESPLSAVQRRTVVDLIEPSAGQRFRRGIARELRASLEDGVAPFLPWRGPPLSLSKERLNLLGRCEGLFEADLRGERPPFVHNQASARGT